MFIQSAQNIQLTNLIVGDSYRLVFSQLNNNASVEPQVIEFIANNLTQNISFLVSYDTNTLVTLRIDTINLSKNKTNTDSILIKCNDYDLCIIASTPKATSSPTPTTTPTPTKTKNIILTTPTTTPTRSPTPFATPTPTPTPSNACVPNKPISVEAVCEPCVGNTDENSNITVKVTVVGDPKTCSDFDYFVAEVFLAEYPVGDTGLVDGFGASQDTFIFSLPMLYGGNSDQLYGFRVKAVSSPVDGSNRESEYTYAPQQFSRNLCCPVTQTPTPSLTVTPSITPTLTSTPILTSTNTPTTTPTITKTPTVTPTKTPTVTPTKTSTLMPSSTPTLTPSSTPTLTPSSTPTVTPTPTNASTSMLLFHYDNDIFTNSGYASNLWQYNVAGSGTPGATISSNSKFGNGSVLFNGTSLISGAILDGMKPSGWWDSDFTIEAWTYPTGTNIIQTIFMAGAVSPVYPSIVGGIHIHLNTDNSVAFNNALTASCNGGNAPINQWSHIACVRDSNNPNSSLRNRLYINGQLVSSANQGFPLSENIYSIGGSKAYNWYFNGYIDELRVILSPIYNDNFTPPTAPFD